MRQIARRALPQRSAGYLSRKQRELDAQPDRDARVTWKRARQTVAVQRVLAVLCIMARDRERCMFCEDSRGTDIDHFWPLAGYRERVFRWENLLLACAGCNRKKGGRIDTDDEGQPLLIDPTACNPWKHLFFDSSTGCITPRWVSSEAEDLRGRYSIDNLPLNHEAVTNGRTRALRNLRRAVHRVLEMIRSRSGESEDDITEFLEAVRDNDDYGLGPWFFRESGKSEEPFSSLASESEEVWRRAREAVSE